MNPFLYIAPATVGLIAHILDWWTYNDLMPTLTVLGESVGLSPIAQVTLLPALSVFLGTRRYHFQHSQWP